MLRIYVIYAVNFSFKVNIVKRKIRHRHSHLFIFKETRPTSNEVGKAHRVASGKRKIIQEAWDVVIASTITHHVAKSFCQKIKLRLLRYPRHLQQVPRSSFHWT